MSEDNEMQLSYMYIWKQTILELADPPLVLKLPLMSFFSLLCKLYQCLRLFQMKLCYGK